MMAPMPTEQLEQVGTCWECGYALRGLPTPRCPECGRRFDPADPASMNMGEDPRPWVRRLMRPPGWPLHALTAVAILLSVWAAAAPMPPGRIGAVLIELWREFNSTSSWLPSGWGLLKHYEALEVRFLYAFIAWAVVMLLWSARRVVRGAMVWRVARRAPAKFAYWRRWLATWFLLAGTTLFCMTPAPVYLGFWLSKGALEAESLRRPVPPYRSGGWPYLQPDHAVWIGIYPVSAERRADSFGGYVPISSWGGFDYSPRAAAAATAGPFGAGSSSDDHHKPMGGGWYRFEVDHVGW
jgi:hypothetical protein